LSIRAAPPRQAGLVQLVPLTRQAAALRRDFGAFVDAFHRHIWRRAHARAWWSDFPRDRLGRFKGEAGAVPDRTAMRIGVRTSDHQAIIKAWTS